VSTTTLFLLWPEPRNGRRKLPQGLHKGYSVDRIPQHASERHWRHILQLLLEAIESAQNLRILVLLGLLGRTLTTTTSVIVDRFQARHLFAILSGPVFLVRIDQSFGRQMAGCWAHAILPGAKAFLAGQVVA